MEESLGRVFKAVVSETHVNSSDRWNELVPASIAYLCMIQLFGEANVDGRKVSVDQLR